MQPTVFITGSSRGIGRAAALEFAKSGYNVAINGRTYSEDLKSLETQLIQMGVNVLALAGDVSQPEDVNKMFDMIFERFGKIDLLINNAGISYVGLITDMTDEDWRNILDTNLSSVFYCCRRAISSMVHNKSGKIINVSSVWGICGASCEAAYSATKGGIGAFTKALAKEVAPSGISVNAVAFGAVDTDMNKCFSKDEISALAEEIPAGRLAAAEEAGKMLFDTAQLPDYMTGQIITFDGGWI